MLKTIENAKIAYLDFDLKDVKMVHGVTVTFTDPNELVVFLYIYVPPSVTIVI